jgi:hypothetical protein
MNMNVYRLITLIYLIPIAIMHIAANTVSTGVAADLSSILFGITLGLIGFTALPWIGGVLGIEATKAKPVEWIYNGAMVAFCIGTFFFMRDINASTTDLRSIFALVWEWLSIAIGLLSFMAFWTVKGATIQKILLDDGELGHL